MKTVIVALMLVSLSSTSALAQAASAESNPLLGTWTLNVAKSSIDYAPLPRDENRTYRAAPNDGMVLSGSVVRVRIHGGAGWTRVSDAGNRNPQRR